MAPRKFLLTNASRHTASVYMPVTAYADYTNHNIKKRRRQIYDSKKMVLNIPFVHLPAIILLATEAYREYSVAKDVLPKLLQRLFGKEKGVPSVRSEPF